MTPISPSREPAGDGSRRVPAAWILALGLVALTACQTPPAQPPAAAPAPAPVPVAAPPETPPPPPPKPAPPPPPPDPAEQIQALNAAYLALVRQDRETEAQAAFGRLLSASLAQRQVPIRLLFGAGSTAYWPDPALRKRYAGWLAELARQLQASARTCVRIDGVASRQGADAGSRRLALQRAQAVRQQLLKLAPDLGPRLTATGQVPEKAQAAPGSGDADRRVEFKVVDCG